MRITSGGKVQINTSGTSRSTMLDIVNLSGNASIACQVALNGDNVINFFNESGTYVSSVVVNASSVAYNTSSDYRLKEDLQDYNGVEIINKIKTYDYKWKNIDFRSYGVLAHELQEIMPDIISGQKDEVDEEGNEIMQGVDYSKIVPVLVKAVQEQQSQIEILKAEIQTLKQ